MRWKYHVWRIMHAALGVSGFIGILIVLAMIAFGCASYGYKTTETKGPGGFSQSTREVTAQEPRINANAIEGIKGAATGIMGIISPMIPGAGPVIGSIVALILGGGAVGGAVHIGHKKVNRIKDEEYYWGLAERAEKRKK
jgi:NADH:ubiquinone oxidoreductase subunit 3 (subunit A)